MRDTIAAIATGGGVSAIGIVRVSGDLAITTAGRIFRATNGTALCDAVNRKMYYGRLTGADGRLIDLCMCMVSRGPESYTGEDTAEFHCHGSPVVMSEILRELFSLGVRQARAGEFTKRAFLNSRLDLAQAEAVIDLIEAESPAGAQNAAWQLQGAVSLRLNNAYGSLLDVIAHFHAFLDYPDEDIGDFRIGGYYPVLCDVGQELASLLSTLDRGKILRDGVPTVIAGRPNTGKSSLLNLLLGYDRAIVTEIAGTTRDTIEEKVLVGGLLLRLIDTAGLRKTADTIETLGAGRTRVALGGAGLVIIVFDGSEPLCEEDHEVLSLLPPGTPCIAAVNKSDLPSRISEAELSALGLDYCRISALTGEGLGILETAIIKCFPESAKPPSGEVISNARQAEAISRAKSGVDLAIEAIKASVTPDAILTDIEAALEAIGEVTGKTMRDDVIDRIFERFCVGK